MIDIRVIISVMVLDNANVIIENDRKRLGLPIAPLDMEYGNSNIDKKSMKKLLVLTHIHVLGCPDGWLEGCPLG